jgi:hypothetical protein
MLEATSTVLNIYAKHYSSDFIATQDLSSAISLSGNVLCHKAFHSVGKFLLL